LRALRHPLRLCVKKNHAEENATKWLGIEWFCLRPLHEKMTENELSKLIVDLCFKIHTHYGPGLFESVYEEIFCYEWNKNKIPYLRQCAVPLIHENMKMEAGFRADIIVDNKVIIEFKSLETLAEVHFKQMLTYLKLTTCRLGLLINFNTALLKNGIHRIVNNL
jgi:GxxExxY protein